MRDLIIPKPCRESWDGMDGSLTYRFCSSCNRTVHDFSCLTRKQAEKLVRESSSGLCARIAHTAQGKILFQPDSHPKFTATLIQLSLLGVSALAAQEPAPHSCSVTVTVSDPSGSPVPAALVTVAPEDNPQPSLSGKVDPDGAFQQALPTGTYDLTVESPGFRSYIKKNLNLSCQDSQPVQIEAPLQIDMSMGDVVEIAPRKPWSRAKASLIHFFRTI